MIIEQIPGEIDINDVTDILKKGYWPSYNIPYSSLLYNKSGYIDFLEEHKEFLIDYDYTNCSRAKIFRRDHIKIKTNDDYKYMMRYNNFENDELSYKNPDLTIASRSDLQTKDKMCFRAIDVKFVSVKELLERKINIHIISSPTNVQQPTFSLKNATCYCDENLTKSCYSKGLVDTWNFPCLIIKFNL